MNIKNIYNDLPYWTKFIIVNVYGYFLEKKRRTKTFYEMLQYYLDTDKIETNNLQIERVKYLAKECPFYSINNENEFYLSPVITKEVVQNNWSSIFNKKYLDTFLKTSGTTGSGLKYPVSREFINHQWALFWKFRIMHGVNLNSWCAYLFGKSLIRRERKSPPFWIKSYTTRQLLLSLPHLNRNTVKIYLEQIKKNKIKWIHAYPSALNMMAGLITDQNLQELVESLDLKLITTSSEVLYDFQKRNIEHIFKCQVRQLYGLTEGVANIFECEESNLHVAESFSYVEFIKEEEKENYKIVGTQYHNKAFPLIRYDTGDHVVLESHNYQCKCGRKSRVIKEIVGRDQDYLLLSDDTRRVTVGNLLFKESYNVKKAQIIQRRKGEAEFYIVKGPGYTPKDEKILIKNIIEFLGKDFKYNIVYSENLLTSVNGKTRLIINEIAEDNNVVSTLEETNR